MKYEELKKKGTYIGEYDYMSNGYYEGTSYYYLYEDLLYERKEPTNAFNYMGEVKTVCYDYFPLPQSLDNGYFCYDIPEDILVALRKHYGVN